MPKWSIYIGIFSGLLFIGLGIGLRYYLPVPATASWVQDIIPYFLIGYGIFRIALSIYFIWRQSRSKTLPLIVSVFFFWHCKRGPEENLLIRFPYDGECASCPLSRMDSLLRYHFPQAVIQVSYDSASQEVVLHLDSNHIRVDTLVQVLLAYGYEVGEQFTSDYVPASCCTPIEAAIQSEGAVFAEANSGEEVSVLEQELEAQLLEEPALPQEDISLEDDLSALEDFELQDEGLDVGLDEGLDDLGLEDDLELDMEPRPKKSPPKKPQ